MRNSSMKILLATMISHQSTSWALVALPKSLRSCASQIRSRLHSNLYRTWRMNAKSNLCTMKLLSWTCAQRMTLFSAFMTSMNTKAAYGSLWRSWTMHWHPWLLACTPHTLRTAADMWLGRHYWDFTTCIRSILSIETLRVITSWSTRRVRSSWQISDIQRSSPSREMQGQVKSALFVGWHLSWLKERDDTKRE